MIYMTLQQVMAFKNHSEASSWNLMDSSWISKDLPASLQQSPRSLMMHSPWKQAEMCKSLLLILWKGRAPPSPPQKVPTKSQGSGQWQTTTLQECGRTVKKVPSCVYQSNTSMPMSSKLNVGMAFRLMPIVVGFFTSWEKCCHHQGMFWKADSQAPHRAACWKTWRCLANTWVWEAASTTASILHMCTEIAQGLCFLLRGLWVPVPCKASQHAPAEATDAVILKPSNVDMGSSIRLLNSRQLR